MSRGHEPAEARRAETARPTSERDALIVLPSPGVALDSIRRHPRLSDALVCLGAFAVSLLLVFPLLQLGRASLSVPLNYWGDALFYEMVI